MVGKKRKDLNRWELLSAGESDSGIQPISQHRFIEVERIEKVKCQGSEK